MPANADLIVVALSGGVDSATAAALLVSAGHRVVGITLRLFDATGTSAASGGRCCSPRDLEDARRVCAFLDIPFYVLDEALDFRRAVVDDFVSEYLAGRTPNPCVRCNERVKFSPLLRRARALGATHLATGHYARLERDASGRPRLLRGVDERKDQSYFLFAVPPADLARAMFPLGSLTKEEVRARAGELGLPNAEKPESQEVCFVPDGDYASFVARAAPEPPSPGQVVDLEGRVLAGHAGVHHFTVGQRRGLGSALGGGGPHYVVSVDALRRQVTVGPRVAAARDELRVRDVRWLVEPPAGPIHADVQVRYRQKPVPARILPEDGCREHDCITVCFEDAETVAAPGQAAVFYAGPMVLGGGWID